MSGVYHFPTLQDKAKNSFAFYSLMIRIHIFEEKSYSIVWRTVVTTCAICLNVKKLRILPTDIGPYLRVSYGPQKKHSSSCCLPGLLFDPWKWRQYLPPKFRETSIQITARSQDSLYNNYSIKQY
jgi:hypothetical protein